MAMTMPMTSAGNARAVKLDVVERPLHMRENTVLILMILVGILIILSIMIIQIS
jgi:hypothetical protein